jgi:hypothetical protein
MAEKSPVVAAVKGQDLVALVGILRDMLAAGGDATRRDKDGRTPRDFARAKRREDLLAILG